MASGPDKLQAFLGKAVGDLGAAVSAALMLIGDELGLYRELAKGRLTPAELAGRTGTSERYVREWLGNQAAGGYVDYDAKSGSYFLNDEQALCLADPKGRSICRAPIWWSKISSMSFSAPLRIFAPAKAWNGASIINACFMGRSGFSALAIMPIC